MHSGHTWEDVPGAASFGSATSMDRSKSKSVNEAKLRTHSYGKSRVGCDQNDTDYCRFPKDGWHTLLPPMQGCEAAVRCLRTWAQDSSSQPGWRPPFSCLLCTKSRKFLGRLRAWPVFPHQLFVSASLRSKIETCKYFKQYLLIISLFLLCKCYITALGIGLLSFKHKLVQLLLQGIFQSQSGINENLIKAQLHRCQS